MGDGLVERQHGGAHLGQEASQGRAAEAVARLRTSYEGMAKADRKAMAGADLDEALRQGVGAGCAQDGMLESRRWDFELQDIAVPTLLWHGEQDEDVPLQMGQYLAEHIPGSVLAVLEGESHSCLRRRWVEILQAVIARAQQQQPPAAL